MLENINLEEVLFLDIETVPQVSHFELLPEEDRVLWEEKSRFTRERQSISIEESYHSAGIFAEFGKIICISVGYFSSSFGKSVFRLTSFYGDNEADLLEDFAQLMNAHHNSPFRLLCAHNGKEFDFPYICRRMLVNGIRLPKILNLSGKKPWEIPHLDTMELWKFGDYKHYTSLKLLARIFGIPTPKDDIDGSMVRSVYYEEKNLERIKIYCQKDVVTVAQILLSYQGKSLVKDSDIIYV